MLMKIIQLFARTRNEAVKADGMNGITGWIPPSGKLENMTVEVRRYGYRSWSVYCDGELLCVTEYLKGARAVKSLVEQLQDALRQARGVAPVPESMDFNVDGTVNA